jgi:hypothetical protein
MGTENDRFGQELGRSFRRIWGGIAADQDVADRLASYILRTCKKDDPEIENFWQTRMTALSAYDGLLLRDLGLDDNLLEREGSRSYAAMHASDAYRDGVIKRSRPDDYPLLLAHRLFDSVTSLASVRHPYASDPIALKKLHIQRDAIVLQICNRIKKRLGLPTEVVRRSSHVVSDQRPHLDSRIGYIA